MARRFADLQLFEARLFAHHPASRAAAPLRLSARLAGKVGHALLQRRLSRRRQRVETSLRLGQQAGIAVKEPDGDAGVGRVAAPINAGRRCQHREWVEDPRRQGGSWRGGRKGSGASGGRGGPPLQLRTGDSLPAPAREGIFPPSLELARSLALPPSHGRRRLIPHQAELF